MISTFSLILFSYVLLATTLAQSKLTYINELYLSTSINEPRHEKTGFLHMRKQRRRSASR